MNALIADNAPAGTLEIKNNDPERQTAGEVVAITLLSTLVALILIVSGWSTVSFLTGNIEGGGAIGFAFNLIRSAGLV